MKKIVNDDFNISDLSAGSILMQWIRLKRLPVIDIAEGPKFKYLLELMWLHTIGHILVKTDIKYPRLYQAYVRVKNSLQFRYNHYRRMINRKFLAK